MNTIRINTSQNVELEYEPASIGNRILAQLIDYAVYMGWFMAVGLILAVFKIGYGPILVILFYLPLLFYSLLCEIFLNGQTIGKKAQDIKVIKLNGRSPSIGDYLLRWVFLIVDTLASFGIIAIITLAANGRGQRLGDLAAGTTVIRTRAIKRNPLLAIQPEENYQVVFPEVQELTDADVALIRKLFFKARQHQNTLLLERVAEKTQETMRVTHNLSPADFLLTVLKDYQHRMAESAAL
ncbi:RDD family protein [Adhaeribacter arboris]|uniref:RDD family protein n=1 Tax=Adhaeribacter arboris TaxID=2072846 RepID=A0A2T2YFK5_9BACT|nr:RDD family protein [Adhaeribacter arboris]PSR54273.1 RDD family protein [Adhaeribacter arboris]